MSSPFSNAWAVLKFDSFAINHDDVYDHDAMEEEFYSRDDDMELTLDELEHILPDDVFNRLHQEYENYYENDMEHHKAVDYYDAEWNAPANHIEHLLEEESNHHVNNNIEAPDYINNWQDAQDAKIKNWSANDQQHPSEPKNIFDITNFGSQDMVPLGKAWAVLKRSQVFWKEQDPMSDPESRFINDENWMIPTGPDPETPEDTERLSREP